MTMEPRGKFAQMFTDAVKKNNISLNDLAIKFDYTYEQLRKIQNGFREGHGHPLPGKALLEGLIKELKLNPKEARLAVQSDRMMYEYGKDAFTILGQDPRYGDVADLMSQLSDAEWGMFVSQMRGFVQQRRKAK